MKRFFTVLFVCVSIVSCSKGYFAQGQLQFDCYDYGSTRSSIDIKWNEGDTISFVIELCTYEDASNYLHYGKPENNQLLIEYSRVEGALVYDGTQWITNQAKESNLSPVQFVDITATKKDTYLWCHFMYDNSSLVKPEEARMILWTIIDPFKEGLNVIRVFKEGNSL